MALALLTCALGLPSRPSGPWVLVSGLGGALSSQGRLQLLFHLLQAMLACFVSRSLIGLCPAVIS